MDIYVTEVLFGVDQGGDDEALEKRTNKLKNIIEAVRSKSTFQVLKYTLTERNVLKAQPLLKTTKIVE